MAVLSGTFAPFSLFAESATGTPKTPDKNFCTKLPDFSSKLTERFTEHTGKLHSKQDEIAKKITENRAEIDVKIKEYRDKADAQRQAQAVKLAERATTTAQKAAVETFVDTIHDAITVRRTAIDAARETFRIGVDKVRNDRKTAIEGALTTFKSSFTATLDKASADCAANVAPKTVRTQTVTALKNARTAFNTTIKGLEKNKVSIESLQTTRNAAIKKAQDDFKTILDKAKADLKKAFSDA